MSRLLDVMFSYSTHRWTEHILHNLLFFFFKHHFLSWQLMTSHENNWILKRSSVQVVSIIHPRAVGAAVLLMGKNEQTKST